MPSNEGSFSYVGSVLRFAFNLLLPIVSIFGLWYLAIYVSDLPSFVIPDPKMVVISLVENRALIAEHTMHTMKVAAAGFILSNVVGIGLAMIFVSLPVRRNAIMPAAITIRNVPYVIIVTVLALAMGDGFATKVTVVTLAGFFPVLVNTYRGLLAVDPIVLDRMRILDASLWEVFVKVRLPFSIPYIIAAQEITGSASIVIAIAVEWMISRSGLGYLINQGMMAYQGELVYAVALVAAAASYAVYSLIHYIGNRLNWSESNDRQL